MDLGPSSPTETPLQKYCVVLALSRMICGLNTRGGMKMKVLVLYTNLYLSGHLLPAAKRRLHVGCANTSDLVGSAVLCSAAIGTVVLLTYPRLHLTKPTDG